MTPTITIMQDLPAAPGTAEHPERQMDLLLHAVGVCRIDDMGWIRVAGADRVRWLNGMVTNSIQDLKLGEGNYSFALNAQGQIQGDLNTFATSDDFLLLQTSRERVPAMMAMFDRFIIMDEVELEDVSSSRFGCSVTGPNASELLKQIGLTPSHPSSANTLSMTSLPWEEMGSVDLVAAHSPLVSRFELWADERTHAALSAVLMNACATLGGGPVEPAALEHLRILEGTPRFGVDIRDKTLAQETGQARALHFAKGCYLGQEIVERIRSRGNVHRSFTAFRLEGLLPSTGTPVLSDGKPIGEITSVAAIPLPTGTLQVGLGLSRLGAVDRGASLTYSTTEASGIAIPLALPSQEPR